MLAIDSPFSQYFETDGDPMDAGSVYFGVVNLDPVTNPIPVYWDSDGLIPASQPIQTRNGYLIRAGAPAIVFANVDYSVTAKNRNGEIVYTLRNSAEFNNFAQVGQLRSDLADGITTGKGGSLVGYRSGTVKGRLDVQLTTYGFSTLQAAVTAAAGKSLTIYGTWTLSSAVVVLSSTKLLLAADAIVQTATPDISIFTATGQSNITIKGGKLLQTAAGTNAYFAGVALDTCTGCRVEDVEMQGMQWAGVWLNNSSRCTVIHCYMHDFLGAVQDSADVCIYGNASRNKVIENDLYGGNWHGVLIQDPYAGTAPTRNLVLSNNIGAHDAYGIIVYQPATQDTWNRLIGNDIEGILGSVIGNSSGAGIYNVGAGGTVITANTVRGCCVQTANRTLAPGAIGINGIGLGITAPTLTGNNLLADNYDGINVSSSPGGVNITGGEIVCTTANTTGAVVLFNACSNFTLSGVKITQRNFGVAAACVRIIANGVDSTAWSVTGCIIRGGNYAQIDTSQVGGFLCTDGAIADNVMTGCSSSGVPFRITGAAKIAVSGNRASADTQPALFQSDSTGVRYAANFFNTTGSVPVQFAGTNTGSVWDRSNLQANSSGSQLAPINSGTGVLMEIYSSVSPQTGTGTWARGDASIMDAAVAAGQPKAWRCTVAGTPGTWVSEGNL